MNCPSCGHENREDATFCGECAAPLAQERPCSACGRLNPAGQKFCDGCAQPLAGEVPERDPRAYTPKHLADKILQSKSSYCSPSTAWSKDLDDLLARKPG